jgi:asparagine synthase (glutamine-hydrolysing)
LNALTAVINWQGGPAGRSFERLVALQLRGRHRREMRVGQDSGAVGAATVEEPGCPEEGELLAHHAQVTLVFDGCLDDRAALAGALGVDVRSSSATDAGLALTSYQRWGLDGLGRLAGDFAIIIWDSRERLLIASRDLFAQRPLYYRVRGADIWIASEIQALVRAAPARANEGMVAEVLSGRIGSVTETLYEDIFRVTPGHAMLFRTSGMTSVAVQNIESLGECRYATPAEAREDLRGVLTEAVTDRLRGPRRVGVLLSGGIDSAAVLAFARQHTASPPHACVEAYTLSFAGTPFDESHYAAEVARHVGVRSITVDSSLATYDFAGEATDTLHPPTVPSAAAIAGLRQTAADGGIRVMLSGVGGDEWFGGSYWHYADLIRSGDVAGCVARWRGDRQSSDFVGLPALARGILWDAMPTGLQRGVRRALSAQLRPSWLDGAFARRVGLADRPRWRPPIAVETMANRDLLAGALGPAAIHAYEEQSRFAARFNLEDRQPFFDRRLVRCALSVPEEWRAPAARPKAILRDAVAPLLPPTLVERAWYHDYSHLVVDALRDIDGGSLFDTSRLAARGWIDAPLLKRHLAEALAVDQVNGSGRAAAFWPVVAMELWYRAAEPSLAQ